MSKSSKTYEASCSNGSKVDSSQKVEYYQSYIRLLEKILDLIPHNIFLKDERLRFIYVNHRFAQSAELEVDDVIGKTDREMPWSEFADIYHEDDQAILDESVEKFFYEEPHRGEDGELQTVSVSKLPLLDEQSGKKMILGVYTDISHQKKEEEKLRHLNQQLGVANKVKSEFMANMSHDLRTPLASIMGMMDYLYHDKETSDQMKPHIGSCIESASNLLDLLNQILEMSCLDSGSVPVVSKAFDPLKLVNDIKVLVQPSLIVRDVAFGIQLAPGVPNCLVGDPMRFHRIILNLVTNSVKFTEKGEVSVSVFIANPNEGENKDKIDIGIQIKDTGIGIEKDRLAHLFDWFTRESASYHEQFTGSGLGLAIVKNFVDDLGGTIHAESEVGVGTTFNCVIPFAACLGEAELPKDSSEESIHNDMVAQLIDEKSKKLGAKIRVLLVEDNYLARIAVTNKLRGFGVVLDQAVTGISAIEAAQSADYDLILMDIGLPDMDGYQAANSIRQQGRRKNRQAPIVALTAHVNLNDLQKNINNAIDQVCTKPLDNKNLYHMINTYIGTDFIHRD